MNDRFGLRSLEVRHKRDAWATGKSPFFDACCASIPFAFLRLLAPIRALSGVDVALVDDRAFVRWNDHDEQVLYTLLPISGVQLFAERDRMWYRHGCLLPTFDFPTKLEFQPLHRVLLPGPIRPEAAEVPTWQGVPLILVPDHRPRPTTATRCSVSDLCQWAEGIPNARLTKIRAAHNKSRVLLIGSCLPFFPVGERFWGSTVLVPLGRAIEPDLPATALRNALNVDDGEIVLMSDSGIEIIPESVLAPLTRTQVRLAIEENAN
jgi:hypothetical protein